MTHTTMFKGSAVELAGSLPAVGAKAPDFRLIDDKLGEVTLATHAGKVRVLTINPSADTSVCATTTRQFNQKATEVPGTVVYAVSADLPFALKRFCAAEGLANVVPLSTFRDHGFGERWGLEMTSGPLAGLLARAVIVIDGANVVRAVQLVPEIATEPDYAAALAAAASAR